MHILYSTRFSNDKYLKNIVSGYMVCAFNKDVESIIDNIMETFSNKNACCIKQDSYHCLHYI